MSGSARVEKRTVVGRVRLGAIVLSAGLLTASLAGAGATTAAATSSFNAVGSVEQVYVTALTPGVQASLIDPVGQCRTEARR